MGTEGWNSSALPPPGEQYHRHTIKTGFLSFVLHPSTTGLIQVFHELDNLVQNRTNSCLSLPLSLSNTQKIDLLIKRNHQTVSIFVQTANWVDIIRWTKNYHTLLLTFQLVAERRYAKSPAKKRFAWLINSINRNAYWDSNNSSLNPNIPSLVFRPDVVPCSQATSSWTYLHSIAFA
jgi:hypothetical protein